MIYHLKNALLALAITALLAVASNEPREPEPVRQPDDDPGPSAVCVLRGQCVAADLPMTILIFLPILGAWLAVYVIGRVELGDPTKDVERE